MKLTQHKKEYVLQFEKRDYDFARSNGMFPRSGDYDYILKICVKTWKNIEISWLPNSTLQHIGSTHGSFMIAKSEKYTTIEV